MMKNKGSKRNQSEFLTNSVFSSKLAYFPEENTRKKATLLSAGETEEGRRQRRFDSCAKILSLDSGNSACAAVTFVNDEMIIGANCSKTQDAIAVMQLLRQRLSVLRTILKKYKDNIESLMSENAEDAATFFLDDLNSLKGQGGFFQPTTILAQALYKLIKSISNQDDLSTDQSAFTATEVDTLLNSTKVVILVAGEKDKFDTDEKMDDSSDLYYSDLSFSEATSKVSKNTDTSMLSPVSDHDSTQSGSGDDSFSCASLPSPAMAVSSTQSVADSPKKTISRMTSSFSYQSPMTAANFKGPRPYNRFWSHANCSDSSDSEDASPEPKSKTHSELDSQEKIDTTSAEDFSDTEDFILRSLNESFKPKSSFSSSTPYNMSTRYVMNIYKNDALEKIDFPEAIYQQQNKPRDVSGFHAEQLIAYYLKEVKKIDLHDAAEPLIPLGISKLCCAACATLYHFARIQIRGSSFNNISGVPVFVSVPPEFSPDIGSQTPVRTQAYAAGSPWS